MSNIHQNSTPVLSCLVRTEMDGGGIAKVGDSYGRAMVIQIHKCSTPHHLPDVVCFVHFP